MFIKSLNVSFLSFSLFAETREKKHTVYMGHIAKFPFRDAEKIDNKLTKKKKHDNFEGRMALKAKKI